MIFLKKKSEIIVAYTVEKCSSCKRQHKRKFGQGDVLFSKIGSCGCGGEFYIEMIYGQVLKQ